MKHNSPFIGFPYRPNEFRYSSNWTKRCSSDVCSIFVVRC